MVAVAGSLLPLGAVAEDVPTFCDEPDDFGPPTCICQPPVDGVQACEYIDWPTYGVRIPMVASQ